ncbi:MAG: peptidase S41, partial [Bacteroidaceae bacterium]|nr:peptidase S41 [Bacteroidaceae bacterium]
IEGHRKELAKKYKDFNTFNRQFEVDEEILGYLRSEAEKLDIKFNQEQYDYSLPYIKLQLKGLIARDLWDMSEYYHVMNSNNKSVQAALQLLQSNNFLLSHLDR